MNFTELVKTFWVWWVTEGGMVHYHQELFLSRGFQLVLVVSAIFFIVRLIVDKNLRSKFW